MEMYRAKILPIVLGGLAALALVVPSMTAASSKDGKKPGVYSAATAVTEVVASARKATSPSTAAPSDRKPGQAWKTIGGTIKHIKGDVYTVEDYEGNQFRLYISRETKQLRGTKKVGDRVRAEITHSGFANSIQ